MYSQEVTRNHRAAIVIAIDQSSSMSGRMTVDGWDLSKAETVSIVTGRLIDELILRSKRDNTYRDYYDIALIGYSNEDVYPLMGNEVKFYPITLFASQRVPRTCYSTSLTTLEGRVRTFYEDVSLWVKPRAQGDTPMCKMINRVRTLVEDWCNNEVNRESFPPIVFNITDGEASDADYNTLRNAAHRLKQTGTNDGKTLFVNIHISSNTLCPPIIFPTISEIPLATRYAHLLMDMSSIMPEELTPQIVECRDRYAPAPYLAMGYNTSVSELIAMLSIGTRSARAR